MKKQIQESLKQTFPEIEEKGYYISLSVSTEHDLSISISRGKKVLEVIELERFLNEKHSGLGRIIKQNQIEVAQDLELLLAYRDKVMSQLLEIKKYCEKKYTKKFEAGIYVENPYHYLFSRLRFRKESDKHKIDVRQIFIAKEWFLCSHHLSHAAGAFYQAPYNRSIVISHDGGSPDGVLNIFLFYNKKVKHLANLETTLCDSYASLGYVLGDINFPKQLFHTEYPGKIMGLSAYGHVNQKYKNLLKKYLHCRDEHYTRKDIEQEFLRFGYDIAFCRPRNRHDREYLEINARQKSVKGKEAYNFAASLQRAFEEKFIELIDPYIKEYEGLPLCLTGGGALNILANTRIYREFNNLPFVPPDPSDCGLSLGALLYLIKPDDPYEDPYCGTELLDRDLLSTYIQEDYCNPKSSKYLVKNIQDDTSYIASLLNQGKIIAVARDRSERGPRALGNRSILASASIPGMKDKINHNVKGREWFRPFAPVVRLEDLSKYFEWDHESRYMSFSPLVRKEYQKTLESITHVDGTSRVQTVTHDQNKFIYNLLTELENKCGIGVVLNTSFNVDSKPIVSSIKDCLKVFEETDLDGVLIDDTLILKNIVT